MDNNNKKLITISCHAYQINHFSYIPETFPDLIPLLKVHHLKDFQIAVNRMVSYHLSKCSQFIMI